MRQCLRLFMEEVCQVETSKPTRWWSLPVVNKHQKQWSWPKRRYRIYMQKQSTIDGCLLMQASTYQLSSMDAISDRLTAKLDSSRHIHLLSSAINYSTQWARSDHHNQGKMYCFLTSDKREDSRIGVLVESSDDFKARCYYENANLHLCGGRW